VLSNLSFKNDLVNTKGAYRCLSTSFWYVDWKFTNTSVVWGIIYHNIYQELSLFDISEHTVARVKMIIKRINMAYLPSLLNLFIPTPYGYGHWKKTRDHAINLDSISRGEKEPKRWQLWIFNIKFPADIWIRHEFFEGTLFRHVTKAIFVIVV
jgi:hypothetical protein